MSNFLSFLGVGVSTTVYGLPNICLKILAGLPDSAILGSPGRQLNPNIAVDFACD
jgi:hypothetical protein